MAPQRHTHGEDLYTMSIWRASDLVYLESLRPCRPGAIACSARSQL
jgi:hypothetical protein